MEDIVKTIIADDITDIQLIKVESWQAGFEEFSFSCRIKGKEDILHMSKLKYEDGCNFVIKTQKDDIREHMTINELISLYKRLCEKIVYTQYHNEIDQVRTVTDCQTLTFKLISDNDIYFKSVAPLIWKELGYKEQQMSIKMRELSEGES